MSEESAMPELDETVVEELEACGCTTDAPSPAEQAPC